MKTTAGLPKNPPSIELMPNVRAAPAHRNAGANRDRVHPLPDTKAGEGMRHLSHCVHGIWWAGARFSHFTRFSRIKPRRRPILTPLARLSHPTVSRNARRVGQATHQANRWSAEESSINRIDAQRSGSAGPPECGCESRPRASPTGYKSRRGDAPSIALRTRNLVGRRSLFALHTVLSDQAATSSHPYPSGSLVPPYSKSQCS